ncbi:MAG: hypothetical protein WBF31_17090, partial [Anaerolineae bacterium]
IIGRAELTVDLPHGIENGALTVHYVTLDIQSASERNGELEYEWLQAPAYSRICSGASRPDCD